MLTLLLLKPLPAISCMHLQGKVVLITGASDGIGAACAHAFRSRGAQLSLIARTREKLERVGADEAVITAGDLKDPAVRAACVEATLLRYGRIDVLINNAGVGLYVPSWRAPEQDVRDMLELNLYAVLGMTQLVVPAMKRQGAGTVVNISSIAGLVTLPWFTLYSASKFAVRSMTDGLRMELRKEGVHAMTVCPGYVRTGFQENVLAGRPPDKLWRMRRFAITAEQCAEAIARGVERDARTVVTPRIGWALLAARALFPRLIDGRLEGIYRGLDL
ncbi:MAG: SDR family NAD(P)-dependent oxidoreductase [Acidobacteriia bacterium]|nr:SDR family NAD(P)-dependent oxidoreductase [Terriglobia bacterium]